MVPNTNGKGQTMDKDNSTRNLKVAGTVAIWVWVAIAATPVLFCGLCMLMTLVSGATRRG